MIFAHGEARSLGPVNGADRIPYPPRAEQRRTVSATVHEITLEINNRHRLLRRGRTFIAAPSETPQDSGLVEADGYATTAKS